MKIYNQIPLLAECLKDWKTLPSKEEFEAKYVQPQWDLLKPMLEDFKEYRGGFSFYDVVTGLNWERYRSETLDISPQVQEDRARQQIKNVEKLLGLPLEGETVLFGAFCMMDGYARFERGKHRVFLGVDESHGRGQYLDILESHEFTHVLRESRPSVWAGFGLKLDMTHDEFVDNQPVVEHLFSEGFSCAVSEIINPVHERWDYVYQTEDSLQQVLTHGPAIDRVVHEELRKGKAGEYHSLYNTERYGASTPRLAHYVWAWLWMKQLLKDFGGGEPKNLLARSSAEFYDHALEFKMPNSV